MQYTKQNNGQLAMLRRGLFGGAAALVSGLAAADWKMNLQRPNSAVAEQMFQLHTLITVICAVIFVAVFGVMFYSLWKHRKSVGHKAANFHENATVEVIWTVIPFLILLVMAWPATKAVLDMRDSSAPEMTIKVTGYQWKWGYDYIHDGFGFVSTLSTPLAQIKNQETKGENYLLEVDNPMVVPVGKKVRVLITANDVLHAWWVPALGVKQDAIPGFIRDAWFRADRPGIYRGNCAELCGKEHGYMPIVVEVKTQADYDKWLAAQKDKYGVGKAATAVVEVDTKVYTREELVAHGKTVYDGAGGCQGCHQPNGKGAGAFPALDGSKLVNGGKAEQIALLLNGKAGTTMASFKHLSDKDLAGVMAYTRSSWSNKAAEYAQPLDFAKARNGGVLPAGVSSAAAVAPAAEAPAAASADGLPAKIYFATGKKDLPADAKESIDAAIAFLKAKAGSKVNVTGYTDQTGNRDANLELAKERAKAVRAALEAGGIDTARINMKKPEEVTGGADNKSARRVEITAGA
ncbi:MAG: cytochrome c oxidase subunit II [Betaproteobacteria bacterium]|nr:MAG: cytochrome c oxidase subunit II [Betaproteobacteria bacterium]